MKPVVTWIVIANARTARFLQNQGPGKGILATKNSILTAKAPTEYSDDAGVFRQSSDGKPSSGERTDTKDLADTAFARQIAERLAAAEHRGAFERLVIVAGPHMLGHLRSEVPESVRRRILAEVDRDLTQTKIEELPHHLRDVIAA